MDDLLPVGFDLVVTVCDNARESCPVFPGRARVLHHSFDDPPFLAREAASEEEALVHYRRVRDDPVQDQIMNVLANRLRRRG